MSFQPRRFRSNLRLIGKTISGPSRSLIFLLALATGFCVANLYYSQPLLHEIKNYLNITQQQASLIVTLTQGGYAAGLLLLVPLGDVFKRKSLSFTLLGISIISLLIAGISRTYILLGISSMIIGFASVLTHILVPYAADLATEDRRGRVVARVMSGLLTGILLSRALAGLVGQYLGWQAIYFFAAFCLFLILIALGFELPHEKSGLAYRKLLLSTLELFGTNKTLIKRGLYGASSFGAFSVLWTTLAFHLNAPPFHYGPLAIGILSVLGIVGIIAANLAGKFADHNRHRVLSLSATLSISLSFAVFIFLAKSLYGIVIGIILLDIGTQMIHITNQSIIYNKLASMRSRANSAYMTWYFLGGTFGSLIAGYSYSTGGWKRSSMTGLLISFPGLALAIRDIAFKRAGKEKVLVKFHKRDLG
jgi:predicted MFS family arabinose efflux permease